MCDILIHCHTHNIRFCFVCVFCGGDVGVSESPLMTWGEIESTPLRLDGSDTPIMERSHGPSFKVIMNVSTMCQ